MTIKKLKFCCGTIIISIFSAIVLMYPIAIQAQYWQALPPYNLLWPLWSPVLSPSDPITGIPTPIISSLTSDTFLPIQPVLLWDPAIRGFPYILYNIPQPLGDGMVFFDQYFGLNPWPPSYLLNPFTDLPSPTTSR